jgi:hypothetical protein
MAKNTTPKHHRQKSQEGFHLALVELNGNRHYLGRYETPESRQAYHRLLAEWNAGGQHCPTTSTQITITEIAAAFWGTRQKLLLPPRPPNWTIFAPSGNFTARRRPVTSDPRPFGRFKSG